VRVPLPIPTDCEGCGVCCEGQEALPVGYWLSPLAAEDPRKLPADLRANLEALRVLYDCHGWPAAGEACIWYDRRTKKCRHHPWRPSVCQDFAVGGSDCRRVREMHRPELLARIRQARYDLARPRPGPPRPAWHHRRDGR